MFDKAKTTELSDPVDCFAMFQYSFGCIFTEKLFRHAVGKPDISGEANEGRPSRPFFLISGAAAN